MNFFSKEDLENIQKWCASKDGIKSLIELQKEIEESETMKMIKSMRNVSLEILQTPFTI